MNSMTDKSKKIAVSSVTFITAIVVHLLYFKFSVGGCAGFDWFQRYITTQEYFLGISYGLSFGFMAFAFLKFRENRENALKAAFGSGLFAVALWFICFFFGCCGSPMVIMYLNLIGLSGLKFPKLFLLIMTVIFVGVGYIWLVKKTSQSCCDGKPCK